MFIPNAGFEDLPIPVKDVDKLRPVDPKGKFNEKVIRNGKGKPDGKGQVITRSPPPEGSVQVVEAKLGVGVNVGVAKGVAIGEGVKVAVGVAIGVADGVAIGVGAEQS